MLVRAQKLDGPRQNKVMPSAPGGIQVAKHTKFVRVDRDLSSVDTSYVTIYAAFGPDRGERAAESKEESKLGPS